MLRLAFLALVAVASATVYFEVSDKRRWLMSHLGQLTIGNRKTLTVTLSQETNGSRVAGRMVKWANGPGRLESGTLTRMPTAVRTHNGMSTT